MPFTVADFPDLLRLLGEHPEWQAALLARTGRATLAVVAGHAITSAATTAAEEGQVAVLVDGRPG